MYINVHKKPLKAICDWVCKTGISAQITCDQILVCLLVSVNDIRTCSVNCNYLLND